MMNDLICFMNFGATELLLILFIVLVLFGSSQLPKLTRAIGQSIKEFKKAKEEGQAETSSHVNNNADDSDPEKRSLS